MVKNFNRGGYKSPEAKIIVLGLSCGVCQTSGQTDVSLDGLGFEKIEDGGELNWR